MAQTQTLQPDAFCEHAMQQNACDCGRSSVPELAKEAYSASPGPLADFKRAFSQYARNCHVYKHPMQNLVTQYRGRGKEEGKWREGKRTGRGKGSEREASGRGGDRERRGDLEQGCR